MTPFLLYQLKAGLCIMLFTGLYYALFRKETFYRFNRFYLLGSVAFSFFLPAIHFPPVTLGENLPAFFTLIDEVTVYTTQKPVQTSMQVTYSMPLTWKVYQIISGFMLALLLYQLIALAVLVLRREKTSLKGYRIIALPEHKNSFSFFNLVFLSPGVLREGNSSPVLQHELSHARQWHSLDIMVVQLVKILQWFNPCIYLLEKALKETHEYLADEAVLEQHGGFDRYRLLLLTQVFGVQPGIFSFFNYSLIKKRLTMMTKEKSPLHNRLKYLAVLPLVAFLMLALSGKIAQSQEPAKESSTSSPSPKIIEVSVDSKQVVGEHDEEPVFIVVEKSAVFQHGSLDKFREWISQNIKYPSEASKNGISGRVIIQFSIDTTGKLCDAKILRGVEPGIDKEALRVINQSPQWTPAEQGGKKVKQQFVMPVVFSLEKEKVDDANTNISDEEPSFVFVEKQALFQGGGLEYFRLWVQQNLVYPPEATKNGIFGRVSVQFAINSQGKVCDIKILRGVDPLLDKEALRVINISPLWAPAEQGGKKVKQQFVMPVIFELKK